MTEICGAFCGAADGRVEPLESGRVVALHTIGRALARPHSSIHSLLAHHGGIVPALRRRALLALTQRKRELLEISFKTPSLAVGFSHCAFLPNPSDKKWSRTIPDLQEKAGTILEKSKA